MLVLEACWRLLEFFGGALEALGRGVSGFIRVKKWSVNSYGPMPKFNALGDLGHMLEAFGRALVSLKASWRCIPVFVHTFNSACVSTPRRCMRTRGY